MERMGEAEMIHREVEEFDIRKLEDARDAVQAVWNYYYSSTNSANLCKRLGTVVGKLTDIIVDAREWQRTHDKFGNRRTE